MSQIPWKLKAAHPRWKQIKRGSTHLSHSTEFWCSSWDSSESPPDTDKGPYRSLLWWILLVLLVAVLCWSRIVRQGFRCPRGVTQHQSDSRVSHRNCRWEWIALPCTKSLGWLGLHLQRRLCYRANVPVRLELLQREILEDNWKIEVMLSNIVILIGNCDRKSHILLTTTT